MNADRNCDYQSHQLGQTKSERLPLRSSHTAFVRRLKREKWDVHIHLIPNFKLTVKVVDIFGNDTMTIVEVAVGGKK